MAADARGPEQQSPSWAHLVRFLSQWGRVERSARGLQLFWGEHVTEIEITPSELDAYVRKFTRLTDGLPLPLMDSFGDCFGPQEEPYARVALVGLDLKVVSNGRDDEY